MGKNNRKKKLSKMKLLGWGQVGGRSPRSGNTLKKGKLGKAKDEEEAAHKKKTI